MITSALIVAYQAIQDVAKNYDLVVLMDEFDEESVIIGVIPLSNETDIDLFIDIVQEMLSVLVGVISRASLDTFWLATTNFNPVVRFTCETATIYQINGGIIPVRQIPLQKYGSNLLFQFRGGYIDRSWAYRENLQTLKDQGIIRHIPVVV